MPANTGAHEEFWPFSTTLCSLLLRKLWISFSGGPVIPTVSSYSSSCHTLSKAFEISKKTALTSSGGLQSNDA